MGMGYAAAHATVISHEDLSELCPEQMQQLEIKLLASEIEFGQFAKLLNDLDDDLPKQELDVLAEAWKSLADQFALVTKTDGSSLEVHLCHYDSDSGDRYDEIEGDYFFAVDGVYQYAPAGERFRDKLEDKSWTVFG